MTLRRGWVAWLLICVGCQSISPTEGQTDHAIDRPVGFFEPILTGHAATPGSHLGRAAALLEQGEDEAACVELDHYLTDHPEHYEVRVHYAELLLRHARVGESRLQFMQCIAQAQDLGDRTLMQRLHCHAVLREIADGQDDIYSAHLHGGIGLYLLALRRVKLPEPEGQLSVESLLCRAAGELALARSARPGEAQPCWYLHLVWSALGQQAPATRALQRALAAAPFTSLTSSEQRQLQLALRAHDQISRR